MSSEDTYRGVESIFDALYAGQTERGDELGFFRNACASRGLNLELGCGVGRVLLPLLEQGLAIDGLDRSASMLDRCHRKATALGQQPRLFLQDMRSFSLEHGYQRVVFTMRSFHHLLTPDEQLACLTRVQQHLEPGGRVIIDCFHPHPTRLLRFDGSLRVVRDDLVSPHDNTPLVWSQQHVFRMDRQRLIETELLQRFDAQGRLLGTRRWRHTLKVVFRDELDHLLARAGFRVMARFGDYDGSMLRANSPRLLVIAETLAS